MSEHKITEFSCGAGCAAKIGPGVLEELLHSLPSYPSERLLTGYEASDDACVWDLEDGRVLIQTVDFFPPMLEDPYTFGQIAAANALSDVWAMGGEPALALNLLCLPTCLNSDQVQAILAGGRDKSAEAGVVIAGGHSIEDSCLKYGLSVTGFAAKDSLWRNGGARPGDVLVLTKPLGAGILLTANSAGLLEPADLEELVHNLTTLNREAKQTAEKLRVHACTDVTGFGLLGHAREMAAASGITIAVESGSVPHYKAAEEFAAMGLIPAGAYRNRDYLAGRVQKENDIPLWLEDILYDPQTSGGLLLALPEPDARQLPWPVIGTVEEGGPSPLIVR